MTTATLFRSSDRLTGFKLSGHAGFAGYGSDIVCSALSAVSHMTAIGITEALGLRARVRTNERTGQMEVLVHPLDADKAAPLLRSLELELGCIAGQYPDHLRIIYAERREFKCFS